MLLKFTSHYVSINSFPLLLFFQLQHHLHPTMYLLILVGDTDYDGTPINLHPTMYLLIRQEVINLKTDCIIYIPLCIY